MAKSADDKKFSVLVELPASTPRTITLTADSEKAAVESEKALKSSMDTITNMANGFDAAIKTLRKVGPNEVTVAFGIKFTAEAGVVIAKAGVEASLNVTLAWKANG